ncbi:UNVERIFIED_CONTAM: hypothetical protein K2H54_069343, partial [Gekko kuhli]
HDSKEIVCEKDMSPKNRCYIRYLHLFSTKKYKVTLTVTNALGRNSTTISFDEFVIGKFRDELRSGGWVSQGLSRQPRTSGV